MFASGILSVLYTHHSSYMERIPFASDNLAHSKIVQSSQSGSHVQKRNRIQLSCTRCRHGKLKCDRQRPCSQCVRKGKASQCVFPMTTRKPVVSLQNRLKHLENLVKDAMTVQNPAAQDALSDTVDSPNQSGSASDGGIHSPSNLYDQDQLSGQQTSASDQVLLSEGQMYVGATHWAAILEDVRRHPHEIIYSDISQIEELKEFCEESLEDVDQGSRNQYNSLLWNTRSPSGTADMLANLPPRLVVDHLISRYFNSASPALCKILIKIQPSY